MPQSSNRGPGGYTEVSGSAGTPRPASMPEAEPQVTSPFTVPDTTQLGYGTAAGGAAKTQGGGLAHAISGTSGLFGKLASLGEEGAEVAAV